jgi:hypothetical protein
MTYRYKGRGMVQLTGNKQMNTQSIPSISITTGNSNPSTWQNQAGLGSIAIGGNGNTGFGNIGVQSLDDLLGNTHYKKYEIYEFEDDVLAISCAWKRLRDINPNDFSHNRLTDKKLFHSITTEDRELSKIIRDHYSKKLMMLTLKGTQLTSFRKDLNIFIHGDFNRATDELFPLIYRLPEFYEYDIKLEEIKLSLEDRPNKTKLEKYHGKQISFTLSPITSIKKHNKRMKVMEYWFKEKSNTPVLIQLDPKNPLLHIWDMMFNSEKVLQISGLPFIKHLDDFEYLSIKNFKLAKI